MDRRCFLSVLACVPVVPCLKKNAEPQAWGGSFRTTICLEEPAVLPARYASRFKVRKHAILSRRVVVLRGPHGVVWNRVGSKFAQALHVLDGDTVNLIVDVQNIGMGSVLPAGSSIEIMMA